MQKVACLGLIASLFAASPIAAAPRGVISFDYCADQHLLALADRSQILAMSKYQGSDFSYYPSPEPPLPQVRGAAEEALALKARLVMRAFGGGPALEALLAPYGVEVVSLAYGNNFEVARQNLRRAGRVLGKSAEAETLITDMNARLARVRAGWAGARVEDRPSALYLTPSGATTGNHTLVHEVITAAGFRNIYAEAGRQGWFILDMERLILAPPDVIIGGFFDIKSVATNHWNLARHHLIQRILKEKPSVLVPGRLLDCTAWTAVEAVERIHEFYLKVTSERAEP
jgi:iron complex transport system substrate-binding protein